MILLCCFMVSRSTSMVANRLTIESKSANKERRKKPSYRVRWTLGLAQGWKCAECENILSDLVDVDHVVRC